VTDASPARSTDSDAPSGASREVMERYGRFTCDLLLHGLRTPG
jgi:hypothetical protein